MVCPNLISRYSTWSKNPVQMSTVSNGMTSIFPSGNSGTDIATKCHYPTLQPVPQNGSKKGFFLGTWVNHSVGEMQTGILWRPFAAHRPATPGKVLGELPGTPAPCLLQTRWCCQQGLVEVCGPRVAAALVDQCIPPRKRSYWCCCCSRRSCFAAWVRAARSTGLEGAGPLRGPAACIKQQIQDKHMNLFLYRKLCNGSSSLKLNSAPLMKLSEPLSFE